MPRIGRYEIEGEAGRGAMGVVHRAHDPVIGRRVAVKTIRLSDVPSAKEREQLRASLAREARAAGMLQHPNIVTVFDYGEENDLAYLAMEYVPGLTLDQVLSNDGMLDKRRVLPVLEQVASALDHAHGKGVIHRDVKPGNVMFDERGMAKVTDFGVAKQVSHEATLSGTVMGTPSYMSPEQIDGKPVTGRSDLFALAVLAYELLTGERPFTGDSMAQLLFRIARESATAPSRLNPSLGAETDAVFERALSKDPQVRQDSCAAFVSELAGALRMAGDWTPLPRNSADSLPTVAEARRETDAAVASPPGPTVVSGGDSARPPGPGRQSALDGPASSRIRRGDDGPSRLGWLIPGLVAVALSGIAAVVVWQRMSSKPPAPEAPKVEQVRVEPPVAAPVPAVVPESKPAPAPPPEPDAAKPTARPPERATELKRGRGMDVPAAPRGEAEPESAVVVFTSDPPGAKVTMDRSRESCTTPCELELASGAHVLKFTFAGHRTGQAIIESPKQTSVHVPLDMIAGTIAIKSTPPGARITIDGAVRGEVTPAMIRLPAGRHRILLSKAGHPDHSQDIEVKDQVITNIEINWQP